MAATKRKFTVPTVEDLDEARQEIKVKPLFSTYSKSNEIVLGARDDSSTTTGVNEDLNNAEHSPATEKTVDSETTQSRQGKDLDKMIVRENCVPNQDPSSREGLQPANSLTESKPTVGKTFRETFAFLEDTNHYKETVAKIKDKEYVFDIIIRNKGLISPNQDQIKTLNQTQVNLINLTVKLRKLECLLLLNQSDVR